VQRTSSGFFQQLVHSAGTAFAVLIEAILVFLRACTGDNDFDETGPIHSRNEAKLSVVMHIFDVGVNKYN